MRAIKLPKAETVMLVISAFVIFGYNNLAQAISNNIVQIKAGEFAPLYGLAEKQEKLPVKPFLIDQYPVTNKRFLAFVLKNPSWQRGKVLSMLADDTYLSQWVGKGSKAVPKKEALDVPITHVSWFAAKAYCESVDGRLPTVLEWEYVAAAGENSQDASKDPKFLEKILTWYSRPQTGKLDPVGKSTPNFWKVYDLHDQIWEWTDDFNSMFVTGDNRRENDRLKDLFCGEGSLGAANKEDYAAFMRYAMRNSLKANFTVANLGFRCVYDQKR